MSFFFVQMSDPQFGMNATRTPGVTGFEFETANYEKVIAAVNRLKPAFVVTTGDMVQDHEDASQLAELRRIARKLDDSIPMYWAAGNCDVGNALTSATLSRYRERFGEDNYSFDHGGSHFVVLNSNTCVDPSDVPGEWERQLDFLRGDLQSARESDSTHVVVFGHHPLFGEDPDEADSTMVIPGERRRVLLDLFKARGVSAMFAGHWHRNAESSDGAFQMVITGAVGYPLGDDPSGIRVVKVLDDGIQHEYFGLDSIPESVEL